MLTTDSIEERVWETLRLKKSLFAGVFDSPTDEVSFAKLGRKLLDEGFAWRDFAEVQVLLPIAVFATFLVLSGWLATKVQDPSK